MMDKQALEVRLKELKPLLKKRFEVSRMGYFGSYATGEPSPSSDIDVLVEFSHQPGWEFLTLKFFLEEHLNHSVDLVTTNALKKQLKKSILSEVIYI